MKRFKVIAFLMFLALSVLGTFASTCLLIFASYGDLFLGCEFDINDITVMFYLTFGLGILTALLSGYAYVYKDDLNTAFSNKE